MLHLTLWSPTLLISLLIAPSVGQEPVPISNPTALKHWTENLKLWELSLPFIPDRTIQVIRTRETHQFVYFGLDNGHIAIGNAGYFGDFSVFPATNHDDIQFSRVIDIAPIQRKMAAVLLAHSDGQYELSLQRLNYGQFTVESDGISYSVMFTSPVTMHYDEESNSLFLFHYSSDWLSHLVIYTPVDPEWTEYSTTFHAINIDIQLDEGDRLFVTKTDRNSYILSANTGCHNVLEMDAKDFTVHKLELSINSWAWESGALRYVHAYSNILGYVSSSCIFPLQTNGEGELESISMQWLQTALVTNNIDPDAVEAATIIQRGLDMGVVLVINQKVPFGSKPRKKLMYLGGFVVFKNMMI